MCNNILDIYTKKVDSCLSDISDNLKLYCNRKQKNI